MFAPTPARFAARLALAGSFACLVGCGAAGQSGAGSRDTYANFADLSAHEHEGKDFTVKVEDRGAKDSVFAFHGGHIDTGTEKIAAAVAGSDWNSYILVGPSFRYHVTSAHFDDPRLLSMAKKSERCVAIHGHKSDTPRICVGGANMDLRNEVASSLEHAGLPFDVLTDCPGLNGEAPTNPVNACGKGIQLEFSGAARTQLFDDAALMTKTAQAIRAALDSAK